MKHDSAFKYGIATIVMIVLYSVLLLEGVQFGFSMALFYVLTVAIPTVSCIGIISLFKKVKFSLDFKYLISLVGNVLGLVMFLFVVLKFIGLL